MQSLSVSAHPKTRRSLWGFCWWPDASHFDIGMPVFSVSRCPGTVKCVCVFGVAQFCAVLLQIMHLHSLKRLWLNLNPITELPPEIGALTNLEWL